MIINGVIGPYKLPYKWETGVITPMALWERGWSSNEKIQSNPRRSGYIADLRPWNTGADLEKHPGRYVRVTRTS